MMCLFFAWHVIAQFWVFCLKHGCVCLWTQTQFPWWAFKADCPQHWWVSQWQKSQSTTRSHHRFCYAQGLSSWCLAAGSTVRTNQQKLFSICFQSTSLRNDPNNLLQISHSLLFSMMFDTIFHNEGCHVMLGTKTSDGQPDVICFPFKTIGLFSKFMSLCTVTAASCISTLNAQPIMHRPPIEMCLLCYQQLVNKGAIVSKICSFELKFPTTMFHQSNCLCISQKRNL